MPMNLPWSLNSSASELIGSVEVLEAKIASRLQQRLRLGVGLRLHLAVLEHRFDDEIAILQHAVVGGGADARQDGVAVAFLGAALGDQIVDHGFGVALALVGAFLVAVDQHHIDAGARRDVADAGAHEAGADDGELLHLGRRHVWRTPRALVQFLHRQEQAADHRRGFLAAQDLREVAQFDPQARRRSATAIPHRRTA